MTNLRVGEIKLTAELEGCNGNPFQSSFGQRYRKTLNEMLAILCPVLAILLILNDEYTEAPVSYRYCTIYNNNSTFLHVGADVDKALK